jgi:predicted CXXCH cytochrome family protein
VKRTLATALLLLGAGCRLPTGSVATPATAAPEAHSNILRADYVGSAACAGCHARIYAQWAGSPMRRMTRDPQQAEIRAPFAGETYVYKGDRATFSRVGSARFVRIVRPDAGEHLYRVTRVIGHRYREDFAGVEVTSTSDTVVRGSGPEWVLPVTYFFQTQSYRPKGYSVLLHERPGLRSGAVWNQTCIFCHNTVPWFDTMWGALAGPSAPAYQGVVVDRLLPSWRRLTYRVSLDQALHAAVAAEEVFVGATEASTPGSNVAAARDGMVALAEHFTGQHLVEEGIGCEACHGGGREHAAQPAVRMSFDPRSDFLAVRTPDGAIPSRALLINRTCARCHQVLFSRYPYTWEGKSRYGPTMGGSVTTSGEARDFLLGGPGRSLPCTACHDPHALDQPGALARLATPAGNSVCAGCHPALATADGLARHAHHLPTGAGASCVGCHMPRKNLALAYTLTRYHRIGSPTDRERVEGDRPLECALCHADRSVRFLVDTMERWWGKSYDRRRLRALYGELDGNVLRATLERGRPHEQVVAAIVLAENQVAAAAPGVARLLQSPYPLARHFAAQALTLLRGPSCAIDVEASGKDVAQALVACGLGAGELAPPAEPDGHPAEGGDED